MNMDILIELRATINGTKTAINSMKDRGEEIHPNTVLKQLDAFLLLTNEVIDNEKRKK